MRRGLTCSEKVLPNSERVDGNRDLHQTPVQSESPSARQQANQPAGQATEKSIWLHRIYDCYLQFYFTRLHKTTVLRIEPCCSPVGITSMPSPQRLRAVGRYRAAAGSGR